jgi:hypothetical protein
MNWRGITLCIRSSKGNSMFFKLVFLVGSFLGALVIMVLATLLAPHSEVPKGIWDAMFVGGICCTIYGWFLHIAVTWMIKEDKVMESKFCICERPVFKVLEMGDAEVPDIISDDCSVCGKEMPLDDRTEYESRNGVRFSGTPLD